MKTIVAHLGIGLCGCSREEEFEVEDDATDDDIDEAVQAWVNETVSWGWDVK